MGDYVCTQCPRSFKLEDFYEKHKKVHELKKQHRCDVCGFVYGAAKGLEGHLKTHSPEELAAAAAAAVNHAPKAEPADQDELASPPHMQFHFLSREGVLTQSKNYESSISILKTDELTISKIAFPTGTGNYQVYDSLPEFVDSYPNENGFFTCNLCNREFSGLNSLKKHAPIHTRRIQHQCDTCGHVFGKKEYLLDHKRKHTGEVSPVCDVCRQTFNKALKLKEHYRLHRNVSADGSFHKVLPFRCHLCREVFQQASVLSIHLTTSHAEILHKCDLCEATFGDVRGKNHHMYNEHQVDTFQQKCVWCPVCNQGFTRHYNLKVHMYKAHGKEFVDNNFTEAELAVLFKSPSSSSSGSPKTSPTFNAAEIRASANGGTPVAASSFYGSRYNGKPKSDAKKATTMLPCQLCTEVFLRRSDLLVHLESGHNIQLLGCLACGEKFTDLLELRDHTVAFHQPIGAAGGADPRRPGPASRTNASRDSRVVSSNLPPHLVDAAGVSNFTCTECGKVLQHKQSLASHMRVVHGNYFGSNKWRGSSVVDMILDESAKLSPKKRSSSSKNPDANATMCSVCEQVFPNPSSLRNHVVNVHIKGQNHTCDLCGKAYLNQENLNEHIKSKHPNRHMRLKSLTEALGIHADLGEPEAKRPNMNQNDNWTFGTGNEDNSHRFEAETEPNKIEEEMDEEDYSVYEPITEEIFFEGRTIYPSYVILPYVTDEEVADITNDNLAAADDESDEEGELVIDFGADDAEYIPSKPAPKSKKLIAIQMQLDQQTLEQEKSKLQSIKSENGLLIGFDQIQLPDLSPALSLSAILKKKNLDELPPDTLHQIEMMEKAKEIKELNASVREKILAESAKAARKEARAAMPMRKSVEASSKPPTQTVVSDYETEVQEDQWPVECIKCDMELHDLETFNQHMNDHWSDNKCCPVCGLLINSKRFNFKQHLKIHTGEKPFVCGVCKRSFRQKAHMVKHVTTHRNLSSAQAAKMVEAQ